MEAIYLVRYGLMGHVGPFSADEQSGFDHGRPVVVSSPRGVELGEVLTAASTPLAVPNGSRILRAADPQDFERLAQADVVRRRCLSACDALFNDGAWPLTILDAEPLFERDRAVLYYLGPHHLDTSVIRQAFHDRFGLDVTFEPAGRDEPPEGGCGSTCGAQGCGAGGCHGGPGGHGGGCETCAVKDLVRARKGGAA
jgi:cell fate regulator YaaT (PSP1 superfamily)